MILSAPSIPLHVSPSVRKALRELATLLEDYHYSQHARESICAYVAREGTVTGAPGLDADDEADASMVFEAELEPVPYDAEAWSRPDVFIDAESLLEAAGKRRIPRNTVLIPPELEPEDEPTAEDLAEYGHYLEVLDREQVAALVAPIAGGSPDDDDFPRLKTAADRRQDMEDVAEWYAAHPGG